MLLRIKHALHIVGLPFVWLLVGLIKVYQFAISPMIGPRCKFYPSCSAYAVDSLRNHGPIKGSLLSGYRICRCHPWQLGGLDPTPPKGPGALTSTLMGRRAILRGQTVS